MNTIKHKGKEYPTRTFLVQMEDLDYPTELTIAKQDLSDELDLEREDDANIDEYIYFYVDNDDFDKTAEEICSTCLDEPITLIEEIL